MWQVSERIGDGPPWITNRHDTSDEGVEGLISRVRRYLDGVREETGRTWDDLGLAAEAALWFDEKTVDLLKRYLDGAEGMGGDMQEVPTNNLHVAIGAWEFDLKEVGE